MISRTAKEVIAELKSSAETGLTNSEAKHRLEQYGFNRLELSRPKSPFLIFLSQFNSFLVIILIIAALVSLLIGFLPGQSLEIENTVLILVIVFFNGLFGFFQDYKAEHNIQALKRISVSWARVFREGKLHLIPAEEVVPGDIVILECGNKSPADIRVIEADGLAVDQSILTGESVPESKSSAVVSEGMAVADRKDMVYMNTVVVRGSGKGIVIATGKATEVGKIATQLSNAPGKKSPFTVELDTLGKKIGYLILGLITIIAITQLVVMRLNPLMVFMVAVSLGVAAIPEGLPAVVTLAMALGTRKMLRQNALVRKLSVVESLGSVDVICTDKTGTLTENRMTVKRIFFDNKLYEVTGGGYEPKGEFLYKGKPVPPETLAPLLSAGLHCNNATLGVNEHGEGTYIGDPTEIALLVASRKAGLHEVCKRVHELPFSSETKIMVTVHEVDGGFIAYIKGAPERVLERSSRVYHNGKPVTLTGSEARGILKTNGKMASTALRVLGFGYKALSKGYSQTELEQGYTFIGLQGMIDPPRKGVKESLKICEEAGIIVKMLTGDNLLTAVAIAKEIGLSGTAILGKDIDKLSDDELQEKVEHLKIFARVTPEHKVRVLKALQKNGHIVAMTGDGVNDAPALKHSDVGIGMALRGSDLAKENSEMILLDDNFITIQKAIKEGRTIFNNIRKFVNYLLSSNIAEVLVVFIVSLFGKLAFLPAQLLWINLLTDGFPALALGLDPPVRGVMKEKPKKRGQGILSKGLLLQILSVGLVITAITVPIFFIGLRHGIIVAQTMVFSAIVLYEFIRILVIRSQEHLTILSNKWLLLAVVCSLGLQFLVIYSPLGKFFKTAPLGLESWLLILGMGVLGYAVSLALSKFITSRVGQ